MTCLSVAQSRTLLNKKLNDDTPGVSSLNGRSVEWQDPTLDECCIHVWSLMHGCDRIKRCPCLLFALHVDPGTDVREHVVLEAAISALIDVRYHCVVGQLVLIQDSGSMHHIRASNHADCQLDEHMLLVHDVSSPVEVHIA